jgi:OOP family OmpA-OmpF porin
MMNKKQIAVAVSALVLSAAASAQAYVGGSIGRAHVNVDCAGTTRCDNNGTGGKLFGGYKWSNGVAAEAQYFDWGTAKGTALGSDYELSSHGFGLGAAYHAPVAADWMLVARAGVVRNDAKFKVIGFGSLSETKTKPYVGVAVGYKVTKDLSIDLSADFSRSTVAGDSASHNLIGLGVTYGF